MTATLAWAGMRLTAFGLLLLTFATGMLAAGETAPPPVLRVPRLATPPAIDGKIAEKEWNGALAVTGLRCHHLEGNLAPAIQQCTFYLAYDDKYLYLAMRSPLPEGRFPVGACGLEDDDNVFRDDHLEWQILKHQRQQAQQSGFGFFKLVTNPLATLFDYWYWGPTEGGEELWQSEAVCRCHVTPGNWDAEIALPIASLEEKGALDGKTMVMFMARGDAQGYYYLGWGGSHWLDWQAMPDVVFDPEAPAVQVLGWGAPEEGKIELRLAIQARAERGCEVAVNLRALANEQETAAETRTLKVEAGQRREESIALALPKVDEKSNRLVLRIAEGDKTLYASDTPFKPVPQAYRERHQEPWLKSLATVPPKAVVTAAT
ncbi:MAG: hypothetical protein N3A66_10735, partial [Planctomycetota bacterium]|nr:hypothetical protein [Planctomycetota bacterium]